MDIKRSRTRRVTHANFKGDALWPSSRFAKKDLFVDLANSIISVGCIISRGWLPSTLSKFTCFPRSFLSPFLPREILDNSPYHLGSCFGRVIQEVETKLPLDRTISSHYCEKPYPSVILRTNYNGIKNLFVSLLLLLSLHFSPSSKTVITDHEIYLGIEQPFSLYFTFVRRSMCK